MKVFGKDFDYNPGRDRWEIYLRDEWKTHNLLPWLYETYGMPSLDFNGWDYHGGWLYLKEEQATVFVLKWI
jgi:hypothetical protein